MKSNADKCNLLVNTSEKVNIAKDIYKQMHKLEGVKIWSKTHLWQPYLHYVKKIQPFPKYFDKNWGKNQEELDKSEKLWYLFLCIFWGPVPNLYLYRADWWLRYAFMQFWDFANISLFLMF